MMYLPEVLIRVNKKQVLTSCLVQGDDLAGLISDVRIAWGEFARRNGTLSLPDCDEIDLALANVVTIYCAKMRAAGEPVYADDQPERTL
jgi:hypothetical protein